MSEMKPTHLVETWEMMLYCKEKLGATELQKIFSRGHTQINRYCMNPKFEDSQNDPFFRVRVLFEAMVEAGEQEWVRTVVNHLAKPLDHRLQPVARTVPDKATVEEECLDDFPELVELDRLIAMERHPSVVRRQAETTKQEIDETCTRYEEFWEEKHGED